MTTAAGSPDPTGSTDSNDPVDGGASGRPPKPSGPSEPGGPAASIDGGQVSASSEPDADEPDADEREPADQRESDADEGEPVDTDDAEPSRVEPIDTPDGDRLLVWSWAGTAVFTVTALAAVVADGAMLVSTPVAIVLFLIGVVQFARAFIYAVNVRRSELIGVGGLFLLAGSAPRRVQKHLLGSLGVEIAVANVTAALKPYTALAFGALVPMYALGLAGLWAARYGTFPPRPPEPDRSRTR
jgi:hypothetical protein